MKNKLNTNQIDTKYREFKKQDQYLGHPLESLHEMELEMLEDEGRRSCALQITITIEMMNR